MIDKSRIEMLEATIDMLIIENGQLRELLEKKQPNKGCKCDLCTYITSIEK